MLSFLFIKDDIMNDIIDILNSLSIKEKTDNDIQYYVEYSNNLPIGFVEICNINFKGNHVDISQINSKSIKLFIKKEYQSVNIVYHLINNVIKNNSIHTLVLDDNNISDDILITLKFKLLNCKFVDIKLYELKIEDFKKYSLP